MVLDNIHYAVSGWLPLLNIMLLGFNHILHVVVDLLIFTGLYLPQGEYTQCINSFFYIQAFV